MGIEQDIKTYRFADLPERSKQRVRSWYCEDMHDWWEFVYEDKKENAPDYFVVEDISFRGFWSQGDGACWSGKADLGAYIKCHMPEDTATFAVDLMLVALFDEDWLDGRIRVSYTRNLTQETDDDAYDVARALSDLDDGSSATLTQGVYEDCYVTLLRDKTEWWERLQYWVGELEEAVSDYAHDIYKALETEYEHITSDAQIAEVCDLNEWVFEEDGTFADNLSANARSA